MPSTPTHDAEYSADVEGSMAGTVHSPAAPWMPLPSPPRPDQLVESVLSVTRPNRIRRPPGRRNSEAMLMLAPARRGARWPMSPAILPVGTGDVAAEAPASAMPVESSTVTTTRRTATRTREWLPAPMAPSLARSAKLMACSFQVNAGSVSFPRLETSGTVPARSSVCHGRVLCLCRPARRLLRSEEHTSELQSLRHLVCRLLLEK